MSQRLLISMSKNVEPENDGFYDCIYTEKSNWENLLHEWCAYSGEFYLGPWKIRIRDEQLMDQFINDFKELGKYISALQSFDDVWAIYDKEGNPIHISLKEDGYYKKIIGAFADHIKKE